MLRNLEGQALQLQPDCAGTGRGARPWPGNQWPMTTGHFEPKPLTHGTLDITQN